MTVAGYHRSLSQKISRRDPVDRTVTVQKPCDPSRGRGQAFSWCQDMFPGGVAMDRPGPMQHGTRYSFVASYHPTATFDELRMLWSCLLAQFRTNTACYSLVRTASDRFAARTDSSTNRLGSLNVLMTFKSRSVVESFGSIALLVNMIIA